jgi:hypothetical protein
VSRAALPDLQGLVGASLYAFTSCAKRTKTCCL